MKKIPLMLIITLIFSLCLYSCDKKKEKCSIKKFVDSQSVHLKRADKYYFNNQYVYLLTYDGADMKENLYNENCELICSPAGGISGLGDGICPTFYEEAKFVTNIWINDNLK